MRIVVMTPTYDGYDQKTRECILAAREELTDIEFTFLRVKEPYIHAGRRKLLLRALELHDEQPFDYFFWLDSDMEFTPADIRNLLEGLEKDVGLVITGLYFSRHGNAHPLICKGDREEGYKFWIDISPEMIKRRYEEIDGCGFGFFMMSAHAVLHYVRAFDSPEWFDSSGWFPLSNMPNGEIFVIGEDIHFCEQIRSLGYKVILDTHVLLKHKGVGLDDWTRLQGNPIPYCGVLTETFEEDEELDARKAYLADKRRQGNAETRTRLP